LKTIKGFTDDEWLQSWAWADKKFLSKSIPETEVPEKPAFLGTAK
jgi:hypothetical protein